MNRAVNIQKYWHCRGFSEGIFATIFICLLAAGGVSWVYMGMVTQEQWPVRWLEIDGTFERVSAEQLRAGLSPVATGSFFTIDLGAIKKAAYRQPWVAEVTVQKTWPDTVKVQIREFTPVAHWTGGKLISAADGTWNALPPTEINLPPVQ